MPRVPPVTIATRAMFHSLHRSCGEPVQKVARARGTLGSCAASTFRPYHRTYLIIVIVEVTSQVPSGGCRLPRVPIRTSEIGRGCLFRFPLRTLAGQEQRAMYSFVKN